MNRSCPYFLVLLLILGSCSGRKNEEVIAFNNFDNLAEWGFENPALTTERVHSGRYALKIDNSVENGIGFSEKLGKVTTRKPRRIKVECYAFVPETARVVLVLSLDGPAGETRLWEGLKLREVVADYDAWVKIDQTISLPDSVTFDDQLKCYLWRVETMQGAVYIDDLKLTVVE